MLWFVEAEIFDAPYVVVRPLSPERVLHRWVDGRGVARWGGYDGLRGTRRSLKVGIFGFPDPNLLQTPSCFKNRHAFAVFCCPLGGPGPNLQYPPSYFMSLPTSSDRRVP
eukprot:1607140-Pyramimonas_sp.AAC.1